MVATTNPGNMNKGIGAKTLNLVELEKLDFNVPKFEAINCEQVMNADKKILAREIHEKLKCEKYAVRSSALIEDSDKESFAGQFKTVIDVKPENLPEAIEDVIAQAKEYLKGDLEKFSLIVQEYIEPDFAGVTFTRNPNGEREMIVEYFQGRGEELVSGKIKPKQISFYWSNKVENELPEIVSAIADFKRIEMHYKKPQDIEWCIKDGKWYFLQTRPVTTISDLQYEEIIYLDENLPHREKFFFEKNEISEIAPRPTQVTQDLLKMLYAEGGPIQNVYKKYKIDYEPREVFKIWGNELYANKEEELKSLLPSYSYLKSDDFSPSIASFSGILRTIKNLFYIHRISLNKYSEIFERLKMALEEGLPLDMEKFMENFKAKYEIVFETNLLTGFAITRTQSVLKREKIDLATVLGFGHQIVEIELNLNLKFTEKFIGNSLDIGDETQFVSSSLSEKKDKKLYDWWNELSDIKKKMYEPSIKKAVILNRMREMSRWLVVKHIDHLRKILGKKSGGHDEKFSRFHLPTRLTHVPFQKETNYQGVSSGVAEGHIVTTEMLMNDKSKGKKILYTKILSPELVKYFDQIEGIISEEGGMLSHLAIIARERAMPVVIVGNHSFEIGSTIKIDGGSGEIKNL